MRYCKVDDDDAGCITNGNYQNSDDADAVCGIFVHESNKRRLFWKKRPEFTPLLLNGEEVKQNDFNFGFGPVPRGSIILRGGSSYDSFKICLEAWMVELPWFWATVSSVIGSFFCCAFGSCWFHRKFRLKEERRLQENYEERYKQWYAHYRHAMYSMIQSSFDESAPGVKMLILTEPTKLDLEHDYLFKAARKLQEDMGKAFKSKKHPFYVDGKLVLDYKSITFASQISLNSLGKEISKHTADRRAVIIAACDVKEVLEVKKVVREHNSNKERHGSHGRAKFAFMPLFKDLPQREGEGVKRFKWYSFYRFSVMAKMQIAVDEGATGLKLLGIQPNVGNDMTVLEYPALEEDLNEAREKEEYPFITVDNKKLLLDAEEFTMERIRLEDLRPKDAASSYLDQNTNDMNAVIIVSATDADGKEAAKVVTEFHKRHRGTRQVMRAWATAGDEYDDWGGDHGSQPNALGWVFRLLRL
ncbi:unnamed protein product [Symbiodinium sp. CCMP2592]|nr:unnamed protein product [Symbiodinium sp. CCMP2592]